MQEPNQPNGVYTSVEQERFWDFVRLAFEGWIGDVVLILLALMSAGPVGITINRIRQYKAARKDSMDFRRRVGRTLHDHKLDDLISIAKGHRNPGAVVIASGLVAFQKARLLGLDVFAFEAAKRAAKLSARDAHIRMSRGLKLVAAIVVTALFVGVFDTCYDILTGFKGCVGSRESCMAAFDYEVSRALVPTAWGFLVAIASRWAYGYLQSDVNSLDLEMETASLDLMNYLSTCRGQEQSKPTSIAQVSTDGG